MSEEFSKGLVGRLFLSFLGVIVLCVAAIIALKLAMLFATVFFLIAAIILAIKLSAYWAIALSKQIETRIEALVKERNEKSAVLSKLEKLERMRKEFVANVSHELKTPITLIKGFVETLLEGDSTTEDEKKHFLSIINNHANRLSSIVTDLLDLSRIEQAKDYGMQYRKTNIGDLVNDLIQSCEPLSKEKNISVHSIIQINTTPIQTSAALLKQAVSNLLMNAIKYSGNNTEILIRVEQNPTHTIIKVVDEGPGIEPEHLSKIFQRFYRVDKARSRDKGGTGLGLSIVKHIAQAHGGEVKVESTVGKGSTFSMIIPNEKYQKSSSKEAAI
jgi:two-component system, OmpR family, phosphate regulon sensor histidine kinase PhoR